jgi:hypothetical protein
MNAEDNEALQQGLFHKDPGGCSCTSGHLVRILAELAEPAAQRIARKVIRKLQGMTEEMQSGDSGLANLWDEICVQVQGSESIMWPLYEELMANLVIQSLKALDHPTLCALWLQTEGGDEWETGRALGETSDLTCPCDIQETAQFIVREHLLVLAADWTNKRIDRFSEKSLEMDT